MKRLWLLMFLVTVWSNGCEVNPTVGVGGKAGGFHLQAPYPNPFERQVWVVLVVPEKRSFEVVVQNPSGDAIRTLVKGPVGPGTYRVSWDARNESGKLVNEGFYFITLRVGNDIQSYMVKFGKH